MATLIQPAGTPKGFAVDEWRGLINTVSPQRMQAGDLTRAVNVTLMDDGRLKRRTGTLQLMAAAGGQRMHSLWSDGGRRAYVAIGRTINRIDPDTTALTPVGLLRSHDPVSYVLVDGLVYATNLTTSLVLEDAQTRPWGIEPPPTPMAIATPGVMAPGTYLYAMTYIREDGQESGAAEMGSVQLQGDGGGVFWPSLPVSTDPYVTHKALYITDTDGEVLYRCAVITNATTSLNYSAEATDQAYPLDGLNMSPCPGGQASALHAGRLWVARDDHVFASQPFSPALFDLREFLPTDGRVTGLAGRPDGGALLIGTERGVGWAMGTAFQDMALEVAINDPMLPGSLVQIPAADFGDGKAKNDVLMWTCERGVYAAAGPDWLIQPITLERVDQTIRGRVAAVFDSARRQYVATATT